MSRVALLWMSLLSLSLGFPLQWTKAESYYEHQLPPLYRELTKNPLPVEAKQEQEKHQRWRSQYVQEESMIQGHKAERTKIHAGQALQSQEKAKRATYQDAAHIHQVLEENQKIITPVKKVSFSEYKKTP